MVKAQLSHGFYQTTGVFQMKAFESWLQENRSLAPSKYSADIGFSPREDALGGGGKVSIESMEIMLRLGLELYLSEYPED